MTLRSPTVAAMFSVTITDKNGRQRVMQFEADEISIGRVDANEIVLPRRNISRHHTRITVEDGRLHIADMNSTNGTFVNGVRINGAQMLMDDDLVVIGDFRLVFDLAAEEVDAAEADLFSD